MSAINLDALQQRLHVWQVTNFPDTDAGLVLHGVTEELGELCHAHLKEAQGIRGTPEEHQAEAKDAIGDMIVYLMAYCSYRGWSLRECFETAWEEVRRRNWLEHPYDGVSDGETARELPATPSHDGKKD